MRPVSDALLRAVTGSHSMAARARVCPTFQTGTDPDGVQIPILDGDVAFDGSADIRSTLEMSTDGTGMWPSGLADLFLPSGNEIFVERGVQYSGLATEWVSLGYFRIQSPDQQSAPNGPIRLSGSDRMAGIISARLLAPVQFTPGQTYGDAVSTLVLGVYPDATIEWDDATDAQTLDRSIVVEQERFGGLKDLVTAVAKIAYWDHRGVLVIKTVPNQTLPVFEIQAGPGGVLVSMARTLTREGVYNAVVATGEAPDDGSPARGVATDDDPRSPTFFGGPFGEEPQYYTSSLLTSDTAALAAAQSLLARSKGIPYSIDLTAVPNPALEPYDCVRTRASTSDSAELHVLNTLRIPLRADQAMSATTRQQLT